MHQYPEFRNIPGAHKRCGEFVLGALACGGAAYGFATVEAWEAAAIMAVACAAMTHVARTMPLKEKLVGSGAIYRHVPRSWG